MRLNDPRVSILAFLGTAVLVLAALVAFAKYPALFNRGREFRAVFTDVSGLNIGDQVRYGGLLVGSITKMEIDSTNPSQIVVVFRVRRRTPVRIDTRATITQVGLLGEPYLALQAGAPDAPSLPPGGTLPSEENLSFQMAMNKLARFLEKTDTLLTGLERFARTDPFARIDRTIARIDTLVVSASGGSARVMSQLEVASTRLTEVLDRTDRLLATVDTTMRDAGPELRSAQREAVGTLREIRTLVTQLRDGLNEGGGVDEVMRDLAVTADNLARLTTQLERDPVSVLRRRRGVDKPVGPAARD